jgi:hypothetical protein
VEGDTRTASKPGISLPRVVEGNELCLLAFGIRGGIMSNDMPSTSAPREVGIADKDFRGFPVGGTGKLSSVKALPGLRTLPSLLEALTRLVLRCESCSFRPATARASPARRMISLEGNALPSFVSTGKILRVEAATGEFGISMMISLCGLRSSITPFKPYIGDSPSISGI